MGFRCFCFAGVCLSGGHTDQLHHCDSLYRPAASGPEHLLPCMDCLAHLLWTLEHHHDCFPLLQGCQDFTWVPAFSKITPILFSRATPNLATLGLI